MVPRRDNTLLFARQGSASQGCFMQQVSIKEVVNSQVMLILLDLCEARYAYDFWFL